MPELPEVETVMRGLETVLKDRRLDRVIVRRDGMRFPFPPDLGQRLTGRTVTELSRRAKYMMVTLDDGTVAIIHLGMSGRMAVDKTGAAPGPHDHVIFQTDDGTEVRFNDPRRFGMLDLTTESDLPHHRLIKDIGPEPLDDAFTAEVLSSSLKGRKTSIKAALLDQKIVAGLGNIYVCEALFRAGISPKRSAHTVAGKRAARLVPAIKDVLTEAIAKGGSTLRDHMHPDGQLGYFQHAFQVYGREGEPCFCGRPGVLVKRIVQSNRSTFYCPACQR